MPKNKKKNTKKEMPFVSICTPTFNRRPFIPTLIKLVQNQTYPKDRLEWIIIDDGTDPIGDLIKDIPYVKYFHYEGQKLKLGKKRNIMHEKSCGDILVYFDDDDYYPPERISHAVTMLKQHPSALCAGSSKLPIYFPHIDKLYYFGPYGKNHATAGTFAFKRKMLDETHYNEDASIAEEKEFLKNYTIPMVQLEPKKTILVVSHDHNTFDKKNLLDEKRFSQDNVHITDKKVSEYIKEKDIYEFFILKLPDYLKNYDLGSPVHKNDVIEEIEKKDKERNKRQEKNNKLIDIYIQDQNGKKQQLTTNDVYELIKNLQNENAKLSEKTTNSSYEKEIAYQKRQINALQTRYESMLKYKKIDYIVNKFNISNKESAIALEVHNNNLNDTITFFLKNKKLYENIELEICEC